MTHGDDKGLILPPKIAPIQVVIIPIYYDDVKKNEILAVIEDIVAKLDSKNIRSYVDSSDQHTPGWKFNQWEMKGVPIRIEIGPKDLEKNSKKGDWNKSSRNAIRAFAEMWNALAEYER